MLLLPNDIVLKLPYIKVKHTNMYGLLADTDVINDGEYLQTQHCLEIVISGSAKIYSGSHYDELKEGSIHFRKRGLYQVQTSAHYGSILFFIENEFIHDFLKQHIVTYNKSGPNIDLQPFLFAADVYILSLVQRAANAIKSSELYASCLVKIIMHQVLLQILSQDPNKQFVTFLKFLITDRKQDLAYFMECNYTKQLSVTTLARMCGRSVSNFKSECTKTFGLSPKKWIINRRLDQAKFVLQNSAETISTVAYQCGFENLSHFSKAFREKFGTAPSMLRS